MTDSSDRTGEVIHGFKDKRIRCIRNKEWLGIAGSRNAGIERASGKYVFFTDADCVGEQQWIEEGLSYFEKGYVGVEGRIVYVSENYQESYSDWSMENRYGGKFMTGNVAYLRDILVAIGGLDESLTYLSDRALGLEISEKYGKVFFNERMVAIHPWIPMTQQRVFKIVSAIDDRMVLFKKYGDREVMTWRIMNIRQFVMLLCPELILASFLLNTYKKKTDFQLVPITFIAAIVERVQIWKASAKNHVFII